MTENEIISVIIPIYNVERYLDKCIRSVVDQTYKNLEIILVDDESPDQCGTICDKWAEKDKRIRVIHKTNGGLSDARNAGTDATEGDWIFYLDSDDYLEKNALETVVNIQKEYQSDIVVGNYSYLYEDHEDTAQIRS